MIEGFGGCSPMLAKVNTGSKKEGGSKGVSLCLCTHFCLDLPERKEICAELLDIQDLWRQRRFS